MPEEFDYPITETFGNWGGYLYNQVSVGRVFGLRAPGGSPDIVDEAFFGKNPAVPPYVPDPLDEAPERTEAIGETFAKVMAATERPAYLRDFLAKVREWIAERPDFSALSQLGSGTIRRFQALTCRLPRSTDCPLYPGW